MSREIITEIDNPFSHFKSKLKNLNQTEEIKNLDLYIDDLFRKKSYPLAQILTYLLDNANDEIMRTIVHRDSASILFEKLPELFPISKINEINNENGLWNQIGLFYKLQNRFFDSILIFRGMYEQIVAAQKDDRYYKGLPLVWIRECLRDLGCLALAKRFMMLVLIEHTLGTKGIVSPDAGEYFRLIWQDGMSDSEIKRYGKEAYDISSDPDNIEMAKYPEWILLQLDKKWMTEIPSQAEANLYFISSNFVEFLISKLGDKPGKIFETLGQYLLTCVPGFRTYKRVYTPETDYDIVCSVDGFNLDFRSEMGRYFICECKDWDKPADFTTMAKLCRVLDSIKAKFGIIFSKKGISGEDSFRNAKREQVKVFQDRGIVIVVIDEDDLNKISKGTNFISMLREKYEKVRLDTNRVLDNPNL